MQAYAPLGHAIEPKLPEDPVITSIAKRVNQTPAQVLLAWVLQRGTALLTTSKAPSRIRENFEVATLPESAMKEIGEGSRQNIDLTRSRRPVLMASFPEDDELSL
jgi:diketogulonate reductase-like aldo/keto reductase